MLHSVTFKNGQAWYSNRLVRTEKWELENKAGQAWLVGLGNVAHDPWFALKAAWQFIELGFRMPPLNVGNTSLIYFAKKLLCLCEIALPIWVTPSLNTIKEYDLDGQWKVPFTGMRYTQTILGIRI